jgi:hypothetical protein
LRQGGDAPGAWIDEGLRIALPKDGGRLWEQLLHDPDLDIEGAELRSGEKCHPDRTKDIQTVLGTVRLKRSYFYRAASGPGKEGQGRFPLDVAMGLIDGYSAGMAKMMCRAGAMASGYEAASADLKAYAGWEVDQVGAFITEARTWLAHPCASAPEALKQIGYFENNQSRMLYGTFRANGYFIGSGVVEAGWKTVIGQRVKQSGMLWSVNGAGHVIDIRCAVMNCDFEGFWRQHRNPVAKMKKAA